ncbi:hypothetical protein [Chryseobacterium arthrosphaerae]|uniref:hypothetical protein n=1 Tax=Chryseobacterium arthrosphaerae TaxID=651561 RepID=UPI00241C8691|nr:hypothetical protein [Chryseobacterium arthrosphaerae]
MDDYKEFLKDLLLQYYDMTPEGKLIQLQTSQVLSWAKGIIPDKPIDEHDAFEVLKNLGFKPSQKIITEKVCTFKGDEKNNIPPEFEELEVGRILVWNLYEKI